jgi:hypothetical protein
MNARGLEAGKRVTTTPFGDLVREKVGPHFRKL